MNLLFEDMIRAETATHVCRIWRQIDGPRSSYSNEELKVIATDLMKHEGDLVNIVTLLAEYERINSVEIIDRATGDGVCMHKDWP